eukprot:CAMPEP_0184485716 /NCGR_PEP_ID=MMETSP0113_2-20130426/7296_1 /TAXON_ID=91329 /ORGANISM="Norrisiella sphaerica, Strain BC52" /LENGTH=601 /DNA_ID=CAMNT_0026867291 /DNA_START=100 /DNA_END=1905 /DNA_ORIENTATION=+
MTSPNQAHGLNNAYPAAETAQIYIPQGTIGWETPLVQGLIGSRNRQKKVRQRNGAPENAANGHSVETNVRVTKPVQPPKKPKTAYNFFQRNAQRNLYNKSYSQGAARNIGTLWRQLSEAERKYYEDLARADKERYNREQAMYIESIKTRPNSKTGRAAQPLNAEMLVKHVKAEQHQSKDAPLVSATTSNHVAPFQAQRVAHQNLQHMNPSASYQTHKQDEKQPQQQQRSLNEILVTARVRAMQWKKAELEANAWARAYVRAQLENRRRGQKSQTSRTPDEASGSAQQTSGKAGIPKDCTVASRLLKKETYRKDKTVRENSLTSVPEPKPSKLNNDLFKGIPKALLQKLQTLRENPAKYWKNRSEEEKAQEILALGVVLASWSGSEQATSALRVLEANGKVHEEALSKSRSKSKKQRRKKRRLKDTSKENGKQTLSQISISVKKSKYRKPKGISISAASASKAMNPEGITSFLRDVQAISFDSAMDACREEDKVKKNRSWIGHLDIVNPIVEDEDFGHEDFGSRKTRASSTGSDNDSTTSPTKELMEFLDEDQAMISSEMVGMTEVSPHFLGIGYDFAGFEDQSKGSNFSGFVTMEGPSALA